MNPLTLSQIQTLLTQQIGTLTPAQLAQLQDALRRRYWPQTNPQPTLNTIAAGWSN